MSGDGRLSYETIVTLAERESGEPFVLERPGIEAHFAGYRLIKA